MQHHAVQERIELANTLREVGPQAPTLCGGWTSGQLAAHLVLRERSLSEVAGRLPVSALRRRAETGLDDYLRREGYPAVVAAFEAGPPVWSPLWLAPVREAINLLEYVVHHEDVRRAGASWTPRALPVARQRAIWSRLRIAAPLNLRGVAAGIELAWPSHGTILSWRARHGAPVVTVTGDPVELALLAFGRQRAAQLDYDGPAAEVATVTGAAIAI